MRIGLIGADGTGKTDVAQLLSASLNLPYLPPVIKEVFTRHRKTPTDLIAMSHEERWVILWDNFVAKLEQDSANPEGIFDRTLLDNLMQCLIYCHFIIDHKPINDMLRLVKYNLGNYDYLFYFPLYDWVAQNDVLWYHSIANRTLQDLILRGYLHEHDIKFYLIPNSAPSHRLEFAQSIIADPTSQTPTPISQILNAATLTAVVAAASQQVIIVPQQTISVDNLPLQSENTAGQKTEITLNKPDGKD